MKISPYSSYLELQPIALLVRQFFYYLQKVGVTPESQAMRNFNCLDFCNDISGKPARIRIIDIQNPGL
jgi:hypothetical protein